MKKKQKHFSWLEKHGAVYKIMMILYKHDLMQLKSPLFDEYSIEAKRLVAAINNHNHNWRLYSDCGIADLVCKIMDEYFEDKYSENYYSDVQLLKVQREIKEVYTQLDTKIYERIFG